MYRLTLDLGLGSSAPNAPSLWALEVLGRDPALIIGLRTASDSGTIGANNRSLIRGIDLLRATGGLLSTLATLAAALFLGEESGDPGVVDEVDGSGKGGQEDEVEEDSRSM